MKIILGKYMDGGAWPDAVTHFGGGRNAVDGVKVCGPMGFLSLLQEKLGLPNNIAHGSKRIAVWEGLLKQRVPEKAQEHEPFYAASFRADSWNTAKRLLQMRDELKEAGALEDAGSKAERILRLEQQAEGCQGQFPRLAEMFRLEAEHLKASPVLGAADRLRLILDELSFQQGASALAGLICVELTTPLAYWQDVWQELFRRLLDCGVEVAEHPSASPLEGDALNGAALAASPVFNCGEHIDLAAANLPEAAEALAAVLRARLNDKSSGKIILLRAENSVELDGALSRYSLPGSACRNRSTARPFVQVLPLYLRLQLLPFDPETLRQFLLLPVCPVEASLRRKILSALKYEEFAPWGEDCTTWPKSWQKAFRDEGDKPLNQALRKEQIRWFCPMERVTPKKDKEESISISPEVIVHHARILGKWAKEVAQPPQPKTEELCKRLAEAANSLTDGLSPLAFEKLLDSVLGEGENSTERREPAPWKMLSEPGQIWKELDADDIVVWWDFTDDGSSLRDSSAWSDDEKGQLKKLDSQLEDIERERLARAHAMAAPFRFARRIVTVTPRFHGAEESMPHPLRALMPEKETIRLAACDVLSGKAASGFFRIGDCEVLAPAPAPSPWQEQKGRPLEQPKKVSPSTLDKVLDCPAQWYFKEILHLDSDRDELSGEAITCGNLAHEVMESLLKERRDTQVSRTEEKLLVHITQLLAEQAQNKAARLALPEYEILLRSMAGRLARSFSALCKRMDEQGLVFLDSEQSYRGMLGNSECSGRYDLMLGRKESEVPAIVADMKWSRRKAYKEQAEKGRAVQLAAYHFLLSEGRKVIGWKDGEPVLAPPNPIHLENAWFFLLPEAKIYEAVTPLDEQWQSIEDDWNSICSALAAGRLPLAETGQDSGKKAVNESPCTWCSYKKLCGYTPASADSEDEDTEEQE